MIGVAGEVEQLEAARAAHDMAVPSEPRTDEQQQAARDEQAARRHWADTEPFVPKTSLAVEELGEGIRCYTIRPVSGRPRLFGMPAACAVLAAAVAAAGVLPRLMGFAAVATALLTIAHFVCAVELESLLVMEGVGLQLTTRYVTGSERVRFVEAAQVKEVFINEATRLTHVIFYMGVVIRGAAKGDPARQYSIVVPFKELEPPLMHLKPVYLGTRALLMGEAEEVADEQRERPDG